MSDNPITSGSIALGAPFRLPGVIQPRQSVYANQLRMGITVSDFTITFGVIEDRGANHLVNEDKISVHLSPITAKILLKNLNFAVNSYESVIGDIPVPPNMIQQMESLAQNLTAALKQQMAPPADAEGSS